MKSPSLSWKPFESDMICLPKSLSLPVTEVSFVAALHISILAECQGTYLSWVDPTKRTFLKWWMLDRSASWYRNVFRMSEASFKASWWSEPDFFHFCMNHRPSMKHDIDMLTTNSFLPILSHICDMGRSRKI